MPNNRFKTTWICIQCLWIFAKNKEKLQKFKETRDSQYIYQNDLEKACFQHDGNFKGLARRTAKRIASDKILHLILLEIRIMMDLYDDLLQQSIHFFYKKPASLADKSASGTGIKNENISKKELAEELHKINIRKFKKRKVHPSFIDNIWGAGLR